MLFIFRKLLLSGMT